MNILTILSSHHSLGTSGGKTGFWVEEFAALYSIFADAVAAIPSAFPKGGQPTIDPKSEALEAQTPDIKRFYKDTTAIDLVSHSLKLSEINQDDYDTVFYPGGHGPLWDLAHDATSFRLIEGFYNDEKPIPLVCHAPAALVNVKAKNGDALVKGKHLTGFSNTEEEAVKLTKIVPFLLEDELTKQGALYSKGEDWESYVKQDGLLITGQNPASSSAVAQLLLETLKNKKNVDYLIRST